MYGALKNGAMHLGLPLHRNPHPLEPPIGRVSRRRQGSSAISPRPAPHRCRRRGSSHRAAAGPHPHDTAGTCVGPRRRWSGAAPLHLCTTPPPRHGGRVSRRRSLFSPTGRPHPSHSLLLD
jgi:hypothetical protein